MAERTPQPLLQEPLSLHTSLELGGPASFFFEIHDESALVSALDWAASGGLPVLILGGGTNLIVPDDGFEGVVLAMRSRGFHAVQVGDFVEVDVAAGEAWSEFVERAVAHAWAGVECLGGIPGTVGAAPVQNIGAYGQEVAETIIQVRAFDRSAGATVDLEPASLGFGYRTSRLKVEAGRFVVLSVRFRLRLGGPPTVRYAELRRVLQASGPAEPSLSDVHDAVIGLRRVKSMLLEPGDPNRRSVGSFFMNPIVDAPRFAELVARARRDGTLAADELPPSWETADGRVKLGAGWLIERAGVRRGHRQGAVGISERHALALVHHGGGSTRELLALAAWVQEEVRGKFGLTLEREPVLAGVDPQLTRG